MKQKIEIDLRKAVEKDEEVKIQDNYEEKGMSKDEAIEKVKEIADMNDIQNYYIDTTENGEITLIEYKFNIKTSDQTPEYKPYDFDYAYEIIEKTKNAILYKDTEDQEQLIKTEDNEKGTEIYKVYNYKNDGRQIFIDDEKTPVEKFL